MHSNKHMVGSGTFSETVQIFKRAFGREQQSGLGWAAIGLHTWPWFKKLQPNKITK